MSLSRRIVAGIVVAFAAVLAVAAPASAHDELLSSTPDTGQRLAEAPTQVTLTFSADVLDTGAAVIVADAEGHDWAATEPVLDGSTVTVELQPDMPAAGYEVRWRVVSSDGHPIAGTVPFTIGDGTPLEHTAQPTAPSADGQAAQSDEPTADEADQENAGALRIAFVGAAGAGIAVALFALILFLRRRSDARGTDDPEH
jgi:methionine-rich copper-binding protein CopC